MKFIIILLFATAPFCLCDVSHLYATPHISVHQPSLKYIQPDSGYHYEKPSNQFKIPSRPSQSYIPPPASQSGYNYPKPQRPLEISTKPSVIYIPPPQSSYIPPKQPNNIHQHHHQQQQQHHHHQNQNYHQNQNHYNHHHNEIPEFQPTPANIYIPPSSVPIQDSNHGYDYPRPRLTFDLIEPRYFS